MKRTWFDAAAEVAWNKIQKEICIVRGIRYAHEDGQYLACTIFDYIAFLSHNRYGTIGFCINPAVSYKKNTLTFNKFKDTFREVLERDKQEGHYGPEYFSENKQEYHKNCPSCRYQNTCSEEKKNAFIHRSVYREHPWETVFCDNYERG